MSTIADIEALGYTCTEMVWAGVDGAPHVYCVEGYGVLTFIEETDTQTPGTAAKSGVPSDEMIS